MAQPRNQTQYSQNLLSWVKSKLNKLVGADDFAPLLLSANDSELEDYCAQILAHHDLTTTQSFINELIAKRNQESRNQESRNQQTHSKPKHKQSNKRTRNKPNQNKHKHKNDSNTMRLDPNKHSTISKKPTKKASKPKPQTTNYRDGKAMTITHAPISKKSARKRGKKQKKRVVCGCQATLHDVFKNCTQCGNILCMIEGEGPCYYCSAFVTLAGSIPNISNASNALAHTQSEEYMAAVRQKDKLLRFGRDKISQTTIIDDQGDFYENEANNLWLSQKEREIAKQKAIAQENKLNESRADKPIEIAINFGTGDGITINETIDERKQYIFDSIDREKERAEKRKQALAESKNVYTDQNREFESWYHNSSLTGNASKIYASLQKMIDSEKEKRESSLKQKNKTETKNGESNAVTALKNKFIEEANSDENEEKSEDKRAMEYLYKKQTNKNVRKKLKKRSRYNNKSDSGVCLSMHQPWASLLVLGIKKVEGRSWHTSYRGRLWIASARREPTPFEIEEVEEQYCRVYGLDKKQIPFPKEYPTTALLGCVDMTDCLTNEDYQNTFVKTGISNENNSSAHCFICETPRKLILPGAISGEHKLWKMPVERIKSMQSGLVPCDLSWEDQVKVAEENRNDNDEILQQVIADSLQEQ